MPLSAMKGPEAADVLSERAVGVRHAAEAALHPSPEPRLIAAASPALQAFERQRRMNRSALQAGWYREAFSLRPCVTMLWTERCYQQISALHSKDFASAEATKGLSDRPLETFGCKLSVVFVDVFSLRPCTIQGRRLFFFAGTS